MSNYPPGVTGSEYAIAGSDYQLEVDGFCPECHLPDILIEEGYRGERWVYCGDPRCGYHDDLPRLDPSDMDPRL